jgi:hypothetical protein
LLIAACFTQAKQVNRSGGPRDVSQQLVFCCGLSMQNQTGKGWKILRKSWRILGEPWVNPWVLMGKKRWENASFVSA